jgi:uncharacterized protein (DUF58 family)
MIMMPTARAAFLFAGGVPIALILVTAAPSLWSLSVDFRVLVLMAAAADALMAFPPRRLALMARAPAHLFVGSSGVLVVEVKPAPYLRAAHFDIRLEQRGALDETATERLDVPPGSGAAVSIAHTVRRRGRVFIDAVWVPRPRCRPCSFCFAAHQSSGGTSRAAPAGLPRTAASLAFGLHLC